MIPVIVAFRYGDTRLFARLVCLLRGGDSAHCEVATPVEPGVYDCVSSSYLDGGVRGKRMMLGPEKWRLYRIDAVQDPAAWLVQHAGAKYDVLGLLGIVFPPMGHRRRRWICTEAVADIVGLRDPHTYDLRTLESACARFGERLQ